MGLPTWPTVARPTLGPPAAPRGAGIQDQLAERWRPYRSLAVALLFASEHEP